MKQMSLPRSSKLPRSIRVYSPICVAAVFSLLSACSPVKGYPGPERPETETATVTPALYQEYDIPRSAVVDGIAFGDNGITVLPGKHSIEFSFTRKGEKIDCQRFSTFDDAGYNACLSNKKYRDSCSCWDYVTIKERCLFEVRDVTCRDSIALSAGERYSVRGVQDFKKPAMDISAESSGKTLKVLSCRSSGVDSEPFEESIGSGRFTAEQYSVSTACDGY